MKAAAMQHALGEAIDEIRTVAVEPALRFQKRQEEQSRDVHECHLVTGIAACSYYALLSQGADVPCHGEKEATRDRFASQDLQPARIRRDVVDSSARSKCGKRVGIALGDAGAVADECAHSRCARATSMAATATCRVSRAAPQMSHNSGDPRLLSRCAMRVRRSRSGRPAGMSTRSARSAPLPPPGQR